MRKTIHIPHLEYTVKVRPRPKGWITYATTTYHTEGDVVTILLPKGCPYGAVAHELIHVLQAICIRFHIEFKEEGEHMAYLMQWLLEEIMEGRKTVR